MSSSAQPPPSSHSRYSYEPSPPWQPPPDPLKPELPYRRGLSLAIRPHVPPPPYGLSYDKGAPRPRTHWEDLLGIPQSEWCRRSPPVETPPHHDSTMRHLRLADEVACADGRGAQIIRCSFGDGADDGQYVAKIYDALYYDFDERGLGRPADVTWKADSDYSREAAAYEQLRKAKVDGCLAPKYHGSWTFDVASPSNPNLVRSVRMIIISWIPNSVSMDKLLEEDVITKFAPTHRLDIFAKILEVFCKVEFHGVRHQDFSPRNVVLIGSEIETRVPDIMLIDFNEALVFGLPNSRYTSYGTKLPISPQYYFWGQCPGDWLRWVPEPHRSETPVFKGWLKAHFKGATGFDGPPEWMRERRNFDEPVEVATPYHQPWTETEYYWSKWC